MKYKRYGITLLLFIAFNLSLSAQQWHRSMYETFDVKAFAKSSIANQPINTANIDYKLLNAAVFYATNQQREKHLRPQFKYSKPMENAAQKHSTSMVKLNFFSHTGKAKGQRKLTDRINAQVKSYSGCAENIAIDFVMKLKGDQPFYPPTKEDPTYRYAVNNKVIPNNSYWEYALAVVDGWMHSPGHRKNILNRKLTHLGCGNYLFLEEGFPKIKSTQNFCSF